MEDEAAAPETCDRCGGEAAGCIGSEALCETCYHGASSCCGLFGGEDRCFRIS